MQFTPTEPFRPAAGLGSPHAQTIYASLVRSTKTPPLRRERLTTPDGDFVDADWLPADPHRPHLLVLHGLEGSSKAGYVAAVLRGAAKLGWGALALNFRSCSGELNLLERAYHSGEIEDPRLAIEALRRHTTAPLFGVGFSLGGNVLLRLLEETGEDAPLDAAVAVSAPYDLAACARAMDEGHGFLALYRERFLRTLRNKAMKKSLRHGGVAPEKIRSVKGIWDFDDLVTAPLAGFGTAANYYATCSSGPGLGRIRRPTLLLSSEDDPLAPARWLPSDVEKNPNLAVLRTERGGHVGFVAGSIARPDFWAERQALAFLLEIARSAGSRSGGGKRDDGRAPER